MSNKLNVAKVPLNKARAYAENVFQKNNKRSLDEMLPDFDENYRLLQKKVKRAKTIPRIDMPVIDPGPEIDEFMFRLNQGHIDLFKPYARGRFIGVGKGAWGPGDLENQLGPADGPGGRHETFLTLGVQDGNPNDDVIPAKRVNTPVMRMLPTQGEVWLEKLIMNISNRGLPTPGGEITKQTVILSIEGYLLDGHHRWGQGMLVDPGLKYDALYVPMDIDRLLDIGKAYSAALGHSGRQASVHRMIRKAHSIPDPHQRDVFLKQAFQQLGNGEVRYDLWKKAQRYPHLSNQIFDIVFK